jgi:hypothetical protein
MDRAELTRLLKQVTAEKTDVWSRVAALQERLNALTKAEDGLQALLDMTPAPAEWAFKADRDAGHAAETSGVATGHAVATSHDSAEATPKGKQAVKLILQSDTRRFWTVREMSDEQIRRGWEKPRPRGTKGNPPARLALPRLQEEFPDNVEMRTEPLIAYRWNPEPHPKPDATSENDFTPAAQTTGVSTTGENGHSNQGGALTRADLASHPAGQVSF